MVNILFVCLGNICRSPMAEFIMKDKLNKLGLNALVKSKATSYEEQGNPVYYAITPYLDKINADYKNKRAERMCKKDGDDFDFIVVMETRNKVAVKNIIDQKNYGKVFRLLDFTTTPADIDDPWYTRDFETCFLQIERGVEHFIDYLVKGGYLN